MAYSISLRKGIRLSAFFVGALWILKLLEQAFGLDLYMLGVYPRDPAGLIGVITAPLIHGSWQHLLSNTLPLLLLGSLLLFGYPRSAPWALLIIWVLCGLGVWVFARSSYHFGASGITHGLFFFLFVAGILRRDRRAAVLLMVAFYMYGGMILTIFPHGPGISFESHFFGALSGALAAWWLRRVDPVPERKRYDWEGQDADEIEDDPLIGDEWRLTPEGESKESGAGQRPGS